MQNTMEMKKSNLIIPVGAVELSKDEMQYVDGGGTWSVTFTQNIIGIAVGSVAGIFVEMGVAAGLTALGAFLTAVGAPAILASAGILAPVVISAVSIIVGIVSGIIAEQGVNALVNGAGLNFSKKFSISKWWIPGNFNINL